jgi:hypothetical protein
MLDQTDPSYKSYKSYPLARRCHKDQGDRTVGEGQANEAVAEILA